MQKAANACLWIMFLYFSWFQLLYGYMGCMYLEVFPSETFKFPAPCNQTDGWLSFCRSFMVWHAKYYDFNIFIWNELTQHQHKATATALWHDDDHWLIVCNYSYWVQCIELYFYHFFLLFLLSHRLGLDLADRTISLQLYHCQWAEALWPKRIRECLRWGTSLWIHFPFLQLSLHSLTLPYIVRIYDHRTFG